MSDFLTPVQSIDLEFCNNNSVSFLFNWEFAFPVTGTGVTQVLRAGLTSVKRKECSLLQVMEVRTMLLLVIPLTVEGTGFKMDFLSAGTVRTDPLIFSQTGQCLSDHVHRSFSLVKYFLSANIYSFCGNDNI